MGCDIHLYAEKLIKGEWVYQDVSVDLFPGRDYLFFATLVGVRNYFDNDHEVTPFHEAKKTLPADVSGDISESYDVWRGDAHTVSWLTLEELLNFPAHWFEELRKIPNEKFYVTSFITEDLPKLMQLGYPDEVRVIFWFDN